MTDEKLFTMHFADNQVILADDEMDIHYMLRYGGKDLKLWQTKIERTDFYNILV